MKCELVNIRYDLLILAEIHHSLIFGLTLSLNPRTDLSHLQHRNLPPILVACLSQNWDIRVYHPLNFEAPTFFLYHLTCISYHYMIELLNLFQQFV